MKSLMGRLLVLLTVVAMLLAVSGPAAMADDFDGFFGNGLDDEDCGIFCDDGNLANFLGDDNFDDDDFDDDELDTIDVGDLECLVEDHEDVLFCVDEDGNIVDRF